MDACGLFKDCNSKLQINVFKNKDGLICHQLAGSCCSDGQEFKETLDNIQKLILYRNSLDLSRIDINNFIKEILTDGWDVKNIKD